MSTYLCTIEEKNLGAVIEKFGPVGILYRFQQATVIDMCCGGTRKKQNIVVQIDQTTRSQVERSSMIRKVRTKPPEGGFESLDGPIIHSQCCLYQPPTNGV